MFQCHQIVKRLSLVIIFLFSLALPILTDACSRALWSNSLGIFVGRNMDWPNDLKTNIWVSPRGIRRNGGADVNALEWVADYGTITARGHGVMTTDGMNEKGLGAHLFWLDETSYGTRDSSIPGLSVVMWAQYYLDKFATVEEAVRFTESLNSNKPAFQIEALESFAGNVDLHLILDDASGDSAIIEYIDGKPKVYHSRYYISATNSPTYDRQLANSQQFQGFGGNKPLPGTATSADRFVRTAFYTSHLPNPFTQNEAIAEILSVMSNNAAPYGSSSLERYVTSHTVWHTVLDLTHKIYYYQSTTSGMNLMWVPLENFHFEMGSPEFRLDPAKAADAAGDVTKRFKQIGDSRRTLLATDSAAKPSSFAETKAYLKTHLLPVPDKK